MLESASTSQCERDEDLSSSRKMSDDSINEPSPPTKDNEPDPTMKVEIEAAVGFLTDFLVKSPKHEFSQESVDLFRRSLQSLLYRRYNGHWNSANPLKGSAFRCLRINGMVDSSVEQAAQASRLPLRKIRQAFPAEVTVWVDPGDVSVRFGEEGSVGSWYSTTPSRRSDETEKSKMESVHQMSYQPRGSPPRSGTPPYQQRQQQQPQQYQVAHSQHRVQYPQQQQQYQQSASPAFMTLSSSPQQHQWTTPVSNVQRSSPSNGFTSSSSGFMAALSHQQQQMQQRSSGRITPIRYHQQLPQNHLHSSPSASWRSSPQPANEPLILRGGSPLLNNVVGTPENNGEEQRCKMLAERLMRENLNLMASLAPGLVSPRAQPVGVGIN